MLYYHTMGCVSMKRMVAFLLAVVGAGLVRLGTLVGTDPLYQIAREVGRSLDEPISGLPPVAELVAAGMGLILLAVLIFVSTLRRRRR